MISTQIATTMLESYNISTVWLPGMGDYEAFETMVFDTSSVNPYEELDMERYGNKRDAIRGHAFMVEKWGNK